MRDANCSKRSRCRSGGKREEILELRSIRGARKAFDDLRLRERGGEVRRRRGRGNNERAGMGRDKEAMESQFPDSPEKSSKEFSVM